MKNIHAIKKLALVLAILTLVLVALGGYVRATGAGLACPDWPLCFGKIVPKMEYGVVQEVMHRYLAALVSIGILLLGIFSFKSRKTHPRFFKLMLILGVVLLAQVILGGLTVIMKLNPFIVTAHLLLGTVIVQALLLLSAEVIGKDPFVQKPADSRISRLLYLTAGLVFIQIVLGGFVGSSGASMACLTVPLCEGRLFSETFSGPQLFQMLHRVNGLLLALLALAATVIVSFKSETTSVKKAPLVVMFILICVQIALGLANVVMGIPVAPAVTHLVLAQLILFGYLLPARRLSGKRFFSPDNLGSDDESGLNKSPEFTKSKFEDSRESLKMEREGNA